MIKADLHMHSLFSNDGELGIDQLVQKCLDAGVTHFSITDHNMVGGNARAAELAAGNGLHFLPGVEIDCIHDGTEMHLLGYGIDWQSGDFARLEKEVAAKVSGAVGEMIANLARLGLEVDTEEVFALAGDNLPSGELIAEVLLGNEKYHNKLLLPYMPGGARSDMPYLNFYFDFFAQGSPAFVPVDYMGYAEALALVRDNGGTPVVAHPGLNFKGRETATERLLELGAGGLEVFNNYHDAAQIEYFAGLVAGHGALMTCGSDFHGKTKPGIEVGTYRMDGRYNGYLHESVGRLTSGR